MTNWDDYRVFLEVARNGSLSSAATVLKMDAATAGRRIQRLERSLNSALFVKLPRGYELTNAGKNLLDHIEKIESTERTARGILQSSRNDITGTIRVGATDGLSNYVLPKVCAEIGQQHPNLKIQILSLPPVFNLTKREADLAIMVTPPKTGRLLSEKITDYHLHLAAHQDYLAEHPKIETKSDLKDHPIVGYIPDLNFDPSVDYSTEITPNRTPNFSSNSVSVQMQLVMNKVGVSVIHDFVLAYFPEFKKFLKKEISIKRSFYMVRLKDDHANDRLSAVADLLSKGIAKEIARLEN